MAAVVVTDVGAHAALDGLTATVNAGLVRIYTAGRTTLLVTLTLGGPAFAAAAARSAAINSVTPIATVAAGTAAEAVFLTSGAAERFSGTVTATGGGGLVTFDVIIWGSGDLVSISGGSLSYP